jgi:hypothetical protein
VKQAAAAEDLADLQTQAEAGELVLLSQDEARFPMVPTLGATPGVKGHRPTVGTRDCKDLLDVFAVVNVITAAVPADLLESPAGAKQETGKSQTRRMQQPFAAHLRHVARIDPADRHRRVVLIIDNAPRHRGQPIDEALAEYPHLEFYRLPSYSLHLNVIERFWRVLRRRATHDRLFDCPGGFEAVGPRQPVLLPDGSGASPQSGLPGLHPPRKPESISGLVNQYISTDDITRTGRTDGVGQVLECCVRRDLGLVCPAGFEPATFSSGGSPLSGGPCAKTPVFVEFNAFGRLCKSHHRGARKREEIAVSGDIPQYVSVGLRAWISGVLSTSRANPQ